MNKYKMISICSLTIACVLMLSILLPIRTVANEKESIEISMHYENAEVTANITVNSDVYTGIVCKYLITDDVLTSDDILAQTRDSGSTINLDKSEDDKYTAVVPNVDKRYVVFYVSIGNCSLCDYIDCNPGKSDTNNGNTNQENNSDEGHKMTVEGEGENGQVVENTTDNKNEPVEENKPVEEPQETQPQEKVEEQTQEPAQDTPVEEKQPEAKPVEQENNQVSENQKDQLVVDNNKEPESNNFQTIEEVPTVSNENNNKQNNNNDNNVAPSSNGTASQSTTSSSNNVSNSNYSNNANKVSNGDKDSIDTSDFEEIEKVASTSTADDTMPQTGENDFGTILGIIVFSTISAVSFYKYKTTK